MNPFKRTFHFIHHHPLAKRHLLKSYYKFFVWQIRSRFTDNLIKVRFIENIFFYAKKKLTGVTGNIYTGLHEFSDMSFLIHYLNEEDKFMDIGANVGTYSLLASGIKKCETLSFEPAPLTFEILEKNIFLNELGNLVTSLQKCVGSNHQQVNFTLNEDTTNHIEKLETAFTTIVETVKVDDFLNSFKPTFLKIDVEGFETEVLKGAVETLANKELNVIIIELNGSGLRYGYDEEFIHKLLLSFSFKPYQYFPFDRALIAIDCYGTLNTIYIKDVNLALKKIKSSKKFKIFGEMI